MKKAGWNIKNNIMISGRKGQCPLNTSYEDEIKLFRGWIIL